MRTQGILGPFSMIIMGIIILAIAGLVIYLQKKLSSSTSRYLGLILPSISLILSIMTTISRLSFVGMADQAESYLSVFISFLIQNIPTIVLIMIYLSERNKLKSKEMEEKMKIKDL